MKRKEREAGGRLHNIRREGSASSTGDVLSGSGGRGDDAHGVDSTWPLSIEAFWLAYFIRPVAVEHICRYFGSGKVAMVSLVLFGQ